MTVAVEIASEAAPEAASSPATASPPASTPTRRPSPAALRIERVLASAVVALPALGTIAAVAWAVKHGIHRADVVAFAIMYGITAFGITVGYHRLFTHRAFESPTWLRAMFAIAGSMALQGPVVRWVADHRRHHASSDRDGDPHSPHAPAGGAAGLLHAHVGWVFAAEKTRTRRFAPDLLEDPVLLGLDRAYAVWALLSLALPAALGALLYGRVEGAVPGLLWGGFARVFLVHHVTWCINSICHVWGRRPFATRDRSTNNAWLSVLSLGESWHNNHHAFPTAARHGVERGQLDPSAMLISVLAHLGLARDLKQPTTAQLEARRIS